MSASDVSAAADIEEGFGLANGAGAGGVVGSRSGRRNRLRSGRRRRHPSMAFSSEATTDGASSFGFSDSDDHSSARLDSSAAGDECGSSGIFSYPQSHRESLSDEIDLEYGELEAKVHSVRDETMCRICHLNLVAVHGGDQEEEAEEGGAAGFPIELGCDCKGDLGAAHQHCAVTWFKIKGNLTCEICGATAQNVVTEQANEATNAAAVVETDTTTESSSAVTTASLPVPTESRSSCLQGRRIMNFLLFCMVFAFVISWLFHFNVLP